MYIMLHYMNIKSVNVIYYHYHHYYYYCCHSLCAFIYAHMDLAPSAFAICIVRDKLGELDMVFSLLSSSYGQEIRFIHSFIILWEENLFKIPWIRTSSRPFCTASWFSERMDRVFLLFSSFSSRIQLLLHCSHQLCLLQCSLFDLWTLDFTVLSALLYVVCDSNFKMCKPFPIVYFLDSKV